MNFTDIRPTNNKWFALSTLLLVLGAETVLFGTLVMSYFFLRTHQTDLGVLHLQPLDLALAGVNSLILLFSASQAWRTIQAIRKNDLKRVTQSLSITLGTGAIFIAGQILEFSHSGLTITGSVYGGVVFALISFHAFHVLAGMTLLALNLARARLGDFKPNRHTALEIGTWFWFYVTAVWLVLFVVLYLV